MTGTAPAIDKLKPMIAKFDISQPKESLTSQFYVFHPHTMTAPDNLSHIQNVAKELQESGLADSSLMQTL